MSFGRLEMSERHSSTFYDPRPQPYYAHVNGQWQEVPGFSPTPRHSYSTIKLLSWNIDFQAPNAEQRMRAALQYLCSLVATFEVPTVIFLQEMVSSDLAEIRSTPWIQTSYYVTDLSTRNWLSLYGTTTLVDRRLHMSSVLRTRYNSNMGRDALFVDLENKSEAVLRLCNTHLESLQAAPPLRPGQVALVSRALHDPVVDAGVVSGDFNAIEGFDLTLHAENGLRDAYLENGGEDPNEDGWTWGMQTDRNPYGCQRLDKMLFCGQVVVQNLERIGAGVQVEHGAGEGAGQFVTDHLGLMADLVLEQA
ncbi:tyrosyl-DNA phosphodiesterase 2, partial [Lecanoromycetidae sp. Uapishka_2]